MHKFQIQNIRQINTHAFYVRFSQTKSRFEYKFEFKIYSNFSSAYFVVTFFFSFLVFCRCTIRENLRTNYQLPSGISTLKVPNNLQRYIDLMDWILRAMWYMNALDGNTESRAYLPSQIENTYLQTCKRRIYQRKRNKNNNNEKQRTLMSLSSLGSPSAIITTTTKTDSVIHFRWVFFFFWIL